MNRIYQKSPLLFSLLWIAAYVVLFSIADSLSSFAGIEKLFTCMIAGCMSLLLLHWIRANGLTEKFGLISSSFSPKQMLYYLPLLLLASVNLWFGIEMNLSAMESALYVLSMIGVGIIEEVLFRGFLFRALLADNPRQAIFISSITFGIGHIVNLLNGAQLVPTLLQILYATAAGFLFTIMVYKTRSLFPCIITHCIINASSSFSKTPSAEMEILSAAALTIIAVLYALWILHTANKEKNSYSG